MIRKIQIFKSTKFKFWKNIWLQNICTLSGSCCFSKKLVASTRKIYLDNKKAKLKTKTPFKIDSKLTLITFLINQLM
jgi:hypothetical protein